MKKFLLFLIISFFCSALLVTNLDLKDLKKINGVPVIKLVSSEISGFGENVGDAPETIKSVEPESFTVLKNNVRVIDKRWFGRLDSFTSSFRTTDRIKYLVLHHTVSLTSQSTFNTLNSRGLSVHYILDKDGTLYYVVDERLTAWHAGCVKSSSCNPNYLHVNSESVGVEIVNRGDGKDSFTDQQYASLNYLIGQMSRKYSNFRDDTEHVLGHYMISASKIDPANNFDWSKLGSTLASQITSGEYRHYT